MTKRLLELSGSELQEALKTATQNYSGEEIDEYYSNKCYSCPEVATHVLSYKGREHLVCSTHTEQWQDSPNELIKVVPR